MSHPTKTVAGLRECLDCKETKPVSEYWPKGRNGDGSVRWYQSYCKPCGRARTRERYRKIHADPAYAEVVQRYREQARIKQRERWHTDAGYREDKAEAQRFYKRQKKRREEDVQLRKTRTYDGYVNSSKPKAEDYVDVEPLRTLIRTRWESAEVAASALGISARRVRAYLDPNCTRVAIQCVDRALTHYGRPDLLNTLYPLD